MSRTALLAPVAAAAALIAAFPAAAQAGSDAAQPVSDAASMSASAPAAAGPAGDLSDEVDKDNITIGIGAAYVADYDGSNNYRVVPAPLVVGTWHHHNYSLIGNRASFNLIPESPGPSWNIEAGPIGVVNFNRTSNSNIGDFRVKRLPERNTAFEIGGYVGLSKTGVITSPYDKISFFVSSRWDVSGNNKSYIVNPSVTYLTPLSTKAAVGLFASGTYAGTKYNRYYYGVSAADSRASGLPIFNPSHDWDSYTVGGFSTYSLTGNLLHGFKVVAGGTYSREEGQIARSPLVSIAGSRNQWIGAAGLAYTF